MKNKLNLSSLLMVLSLLLPSMGIFAQRINAPELNGTSDDLACARDGRNTFSVEATYVSPAGFNAGNDFVLQLSDADGNFDSDVFNNVELDRLNDITTPSPSPATINFDNFSFPITVRGENYSLRIVSTDPVEIGRELQNIPIYYFSNEQPKVTAPSDSELHAAICNAQAVDLTVTPNDFPAYIWYKDGVIIPGETDAILTDVIATGEYRVEIDFGSCNPFYAFNTSNTIKVINFTTTDVFIDQNPQVSYCPSDNRILSCNIVDDAFTYQWFKDGEPVENSNTAILTLPQSNFGGMYRVEVTATEDCSVITNPVEVINLGSNLLTQPPPQMVVLPGETLTLEITTDAPAGRTIQWFKDNTALFGENGLSITATTTGIYRVEVTTNDACDSILIAETEVFIPTDFGAEIAFDSDIDCDLEEVGLITERIFGITGGGLEIPLIDSQIAQFSLEWFKDNTATGVTTSDFLVNGVDENGAYVLQLTFIPGGFEPDFSNTLQVALISDTVEVTRTPDTLPLGSTVLLTATQVTGYTYQWYQVVNDTDEIIDGATQNTLEVSTEGIYAVVITTDLCDGKRIEVEVNDAVSFSGLIPNVIVPGGDSPINDNWVLPAELANQQDVEIKIYNAQGKEDFSGTNYQNNWPEENSKSQGQESVYYYIITKNNSVLRKGSITVMR
ncbi:T9SS type B sorting domain-containing protein [Aquimarina rhabdastrellae]